jgi:hypothetical protein
VPRWPTSWSRFGTRTATGSADPVHETSRFSLEAGRLLLCCLARTIPGVNEAIQGGLVTGVVSLLVLWLTLRHPAKQAERAEQARTHERRVDMRKDVYIAWLKAARFLGSWPSNLPTPTAGNIQLPHPAMKEPINEATTELEQVASSEVVEAANRYLAEIKSPGLATAMNQPGPRTFDDADRFQDCLKDARREVVAAMRRDLGVAKR